MASKKKVDRDEKIQVEIDRLRDLFSDMPKKTMEAAASLIQNAAFMTVTLNELQEKINTSGPVSKYKNGQNQYGTKKSPEVEIYNTMIKNHSVIFKQLTDLLPDTGEGNEPKELDPFEKLAGRGQRG